MIQIIESSHYNFVVQLNFIWNNLFLKIKMSKAYYDDRAQSCGFAVNSSEFATMMDNEDPLRSFRSKFIIPDAPKDSGRDKVLYFVGMLFFI